MGWLGRYAQSGVAMVALVLVLILVRWVLAEDAKFRAFNNRLNTATRYWTEVVDGQAPLGESRADVVRRLSAALPKRTMARMLSADPTERQLVFVAQEYEVAGLTFPCSAWMILADIKFGADDKVISRSVREEGACV